MASRDVQQLLRLARLYRTRKGLSLSTVSLYAAGQGRLMERLESGCEITVGRRDRILQWFSDHWPEGFAWPEDIDRPAPAGSESRRQQG